MRRSLPFLLFCSAVARDIKWTHLTSGNGDLPVPGTSTQQTGALTVKVDVRGCTDFILSFRKIAPAIVWYRRSAEGWTHYVIEKEFLTVEAGGAAYDIDGGGPLRIYQANGDAANPASWVGRDLLERDMIHGHTLDVEDINGDGHLDILAAEMAKWTNTPAAKDHPNATAWILYGDGKGNFTTAVLTTGDGWHEGKLGDFDGDGDLDILNKPYTWDTPRVDVWLNNGTGRPVRR